jgi:hypothetical protein
LFNKSSNVSERGDSAMIRNVFFLKQEN